MKNFVISFLAVFTVVMGISYSPIFTDDLDEKLHESCIYPTVLISDEYSAHGSGAIVRSEKVAKDLYINIAVSCEHVIAHGHPVKVYLCQWEDWSQSTGWLAYDAVVYAVNQEYDIAVLAFYSNTRLPVVQLDVDQRLYIGNEVTGVGCSQMDHPRVDFGKINEVSEFGFRSCLAAIPGDSGGPVFYKYKMVGIKKAVRTFQGAQFTQLLFNVSFISPMSALKEWSNMDFVYDHTKPLPDLLTMMLKVSDFEASKKCPFDRTFPLLPQESDKGKE